MNTHLADDYISIKQRLEEIENERARAFETAETETAVEQYLNGGEPKVIQHQTYMGWDIYPPVTFNLPDLRGRIKARMASRL